MYMKVKVMCIISQILNCIRLTVTAENPIWKNTVGLNAVFKNIFKFLLSI